MFPCVCKHAQPTSFDNTLFSSDCRKTKKDRRVLTVSALKVGSWTKSTEKLQFLVNKEMESKVGRRIFWLRPWFLFLVLYPFHWPCIMKKNISENMWWYQSVFLFLIHGHVPCSPCRKNITEFDCWRWTHPWLLMISFLVRWWRTSQSLTTAWQLTTSRLGQPSKVPIMLKA